MAERNYEYDKYKLDQDLQGFYEKILDARVKTAYALNRYKASEKGLTSYDMDQALSNKKNAESVFKNYLDMYYDLVKFKFPKGDKAEKPDFMKDCDSIHELDMKKAVKLYEQLNQLLEELKITSMENRKRGNRQI